METQTAVPMATFTGSYIRTHAYPEVGLFSKDVEGGLLFEQLGLQAVAACGGRQILPC